MSRACFAVVHAIALLSAACAQGDLNAGGTFGMTNPATTPGDDDDDTGDDDGSTGSATGESSAGETTTGHADGTTSAADSSGGSSGAPITAGTDESSSVGSGLVESSSDGSATTEAGDDMGDEMPMEDDGPPPPPPDPWESCEAMACEAGSLCINVTGLEAYDPYCAPECTTDDDCPYPGGDALVSCALLAEDATEPTHCAVICEYDDMVLGDCPDGMECAEVPDQTTQVALCMWP